jgi:hypothetical protein
LTILTFIRAQSLQILPLFCIFDFFFSKISTFTFLRAQSIHISLLFFRYDLPFSISNLIHGTKFHESSKDLCTRATNLRIEISFPQNLFFLSSQQSQFQVSATKPFAGTGEDLGFNAQECTKQTLTTGPFDNTCKADEVSPEVEAGVVARLGCPQP